MPALDARMCVQFSQNILYANCEERRKTTVDFWRRWEICKACIAKAKYGKKGRGGKQKGKKKWKIENRKMKFQPAECRLLPPGSRALDSPWPYWRTLLLLRLHEFLSSFTSGYSCRKLQQKYLPHIYHSILSQTLRHMYDICMQILSRWFCICLSTKCHGAYAWCVHATMLSFRHCFFFISTHLPASVSPVCIPRITLFP